VANTYQSDWGGLNPALIASFYAVERKENPTTKAYEWVKSESSPVVRAPITEVNLENVSNWNSPFENIGADQKFSSMSALLQSGGLTALLSQFKAFLEKNGASNAATTGAANGLQSLEGRTSVTKLSSRQIYSGSPPMKVSLTAHFRAWADPAKEVALPVNQLMQWFLPQELAEDGPVLALANANSPSLYPSTIPRYVAMEYAGIKFSPMVIESLPLRLDGPRDKNGQLIQQSISMTIAALTSLDWNDWRRMNFK
jgi:hypothetical protein